MLISHPPFRTFLHIGCEEGTGGLLPWVGYGLPVKQSARGQRQHDRVRMAGVLAARRAVLGQRGER